MGGTLQGTMNAVARLQSEGYDIRLSRDEAVRKGYGRDALSEKFLDVVTTEWSKGSVVEVAFGLNAMHGGVYSYRLCRRPTDLLTLNENCFQAGALEFHGTQQWYQFGSNPSHRRPVTAKRWKDPSNGVEWTRLPIPTCSNHAGFVCDGPMFDPPYGIYGYGGENMDGFQVNIVDMLKLPQDLPTGDYVLSFRWDVEDGGQVWAQCANVAVMPTSHVPAKFTQPPLPPHIQPLTRFRKGGPLSQAHCQAWCSADDNCLAFEMSGCNGAQACRGACYHFYTLDFEKAVSHNDDYYKQIGTDKEILKRFIKQDNGDFAPESSMATASQAPTQSSQPANQQSTNTSQTSSSTQPSGSKSTAKTFRGSKTTTGRISSSSTESSGVAPFVCSLTVVLLTGLRFL
jgi:hypothetical protein